jgi:threonylcarbamoyladenosine tRNA methylthiotransferase MtaB
MDRDTFRIENLGCRANVHDGEVMRAALLARGLREVGPREAAGLVIVNSCAVTDAADRESVRIASRSARRDPATRVVVTGCGAEVDPEGMALTPGVRWVVGNQDKADLVARVLDAAAAGEGTGGAAILGGVAPYGAMRARHPTDRRWPRGVAAFPPLPAAGGHTRAFLKVQEGCDAFCTFCVIPYARGPARSLDADVVVARVATLVAAGARELVLTGTALGDWGADLPGAPPLSALIERVLAETDAPAVRLGSLEPPELTPALLALLRDEPRLRPHVHLSLQSPDAGVLRRMKRRYAPDAAERALEALAGLAGHLVRTRGLAGGVFVGMDLITGFPGESEAIFAAGLERLCALPWTRLHVFPYSERAGTAATRLDGVVPPAERKRRVAALVALSNARVVERAEALVTAGAPIEVLVEGRPLGGGPGLAGGHTPNYYAVAFPDPAPGRLRNRDVRVIPESVALHLRSGNALVHGRLADPIDFAEGVPNPPQRT